MKTLSQLRRGKRNTTTYSGQEHCRNAAAQQQQFAFSLPSPSPCLLPVPCHLPTTDVQAQTLLDTFLMPGAQAGCARAGGLSVPAALALHSLGGCMGAGAVQKKKKKKRVMKHEMCWDLRVRACVPACLRDGWVGWIGSSFLCLVPGSCWSTWLGVMGRWCCCFGGGSRSRLGVIFFLLASVEC